MIISYKDVSEEALGAILNEFVTRDGTDYSSIQSRIENVLQQLEKGTAELHFDRDTESCNIIVADEV